MLDPLPVSIALALVFTAAGLVELLTRDGVSAGYREDGPLLITLTVASALSLALVALGLPLTGPARAASPAPLGSLKTDVQKAAQTRDAIVQFGDPVAVAAGDTVGTVVSFGGDVTVGGTVRDNVVVFGADVRLLLTAVVGVNMRPGEASVVLIGGGALTREPGAQVAGDVQRFDGKPWRESLSWATQHTVIRPWWGFTLMGWIVQTASFLVLALVVATLMPRQMRAMQRHLRLKPAGSLGWAALIFFIAGPAVLVVLVIGVVGLLVVIPYVLFALLAYFFATTAVIALVAQRVLAGSGQNDNLMLATTLRVIGTTIVLRIPVLGPLVVIAMILFGTGPAPAPAPAPVPWRSSSGVRLANWPARRRRRGRRWPTAQAAVQSPRR